MFFFTYLDLFTTYIPINKKKHNLDNDLYLNLTQSNGSLSTSQIVNHFVNQNDKVQIDYPIMVACPNQLVRIKMVDFNFAIIRLFFSVFTFLLVSFVTTLK